MSLDENAPVLKQQDIDEKNFAYKTISLKDVIRWKYLYRYATTSHRGEIPNVPDPTCTQLKALKRFLREHSKVEFCHIYKQLGS